jgi:16S rRNA (uracil1498-N3)-methyltransferase
MSAPMFVVDARRLRGADRVELDGEEGRHAAVVRRITAGERIDLTDGAGHRAECVVVEATRSGLLCDVVSRVDVDAPQPRVVVVQALPKGDRGEVAVETMTEVGVDEIVPWAAERSVARWKAERGDKALRRWRSTAREAAKQARRPWHPVLAAPADTAAVARLLGTAALSVVLHEDASEPVGDLVVPATGDVVIVVGPEGGISPEELAVFAAVGPHAVQLGPSVLRTSTAGTVAAGVVLSKTRRWS